MSVHGRIVAAVALSAIAASACGPSSRRAAPVARRGERLGQITASPRERVPSALHDPRAGGLPHPLVDPNVLVPGGPPPDGIPAIEHPRFLAPRDVDFLADNEPVLARDVGNDARAYPVQILIWHEIVDDTVGDIPVAVSYCPLCNSAIAYDRRVGSRVLDFGVSGLLYNSSLVMFDRPTESLWSHFTGQAVAGVLTGTTLKPLVVQTVAWRDWRAAHPDGHVLSRDTGFDRDYGRNPYPGYDNVHDQPFLYNGPVDGRYPAKQRVVGIRVGSDALAVIDTPLRAGRVVETEVGGRPLVVWSEPGTASALDSTDIANGIDVGAIGVFDRRIDSSTLTYTSVPGGFRDAQTHSTWNVLGTATAGPLRGRHLTPIEHVDTFWFAWAAFEPATRVLH